MQKRDALSLEERHKNSLVICNSVYEFLLQLSSSVCNKEQSPLHSSLRSCDSREQSLFAQRFANSCKEFRASATNAKVSGSTMRSDTAPSDHSKIQEDTTLSPFLISRKKSEGSNLEGLTNFNRNATKGRNFVEPEDVFSFSKFFTKELGANSSFPLFLSQRKKSEGSNLEGLTNFNRSATKGRNKVTIDGFNIALYDAINSEVDLSELATALQNQGATVLKPAMLDREGHMEFVSWDEEFDPLGTFPSLKGTFPPNAIDMIVCPLVAFDKAGNRLGYGGGYYDRYLPRLNSDTLKIGVSFACQEVPEIPYSEFDIPLDLIVTEENL